MWLGNFSNVSTSITLLSLGLLLSLFFLLLLCFIESQKEGLINWNLKLEDFLHSCDIDINIQNQELSLALSGR